MHSLLHRVQPIQETPRDADRSDAHQADRRHDGSIGQEVLMAGVTDLTAPNCTCIFREW